MRGILRTIGLFLLMFVLFSAVGLVVGAYFGDGLLGIGAFLAIAALMNFVAYFFSDKFVLVSYRARMVTEDEAPNLYRTVRRVAQAYNLPMPRVAIIPTMTPNAFATGRNPKRAVVAVTEGIIQLLSQPELEAVLGHEMGHVRNRDILVTTIAATLAAAISIAARSIWWSSLFGGRGRRDINPILLILVMVTAPIAALLVQLAVSRSREYKADYTGATTLRRPNALADALGKLQRWNVQRPMEFGNPTTASLFIVNPFRRSGFAGLFSTHPPLEARIERLHALANEMGVTS